MIEHRMPDRILLFIENGHRIRERPLDNTQLYASNIGAMERSPKAIPFRAIVIVVGHIGKGSGFHVVV